MVPDPEPSSPVRSAWRTYRACLESLPAGASHLLIVQDDVVVCRDFVPAVLRALAARPDSPVSFFIPGVGLLALAIQTACNNGSNWTVIPATEWVPAVCLALPRQHVRAVLDFADRTKIAPEWRGDDSALGNWQRADNVTVYATCPSLCDHPDDVPSVVGGSAWNGLNPQRTAACWTGPEWSPIGIQW